jgi:hypothetical protein
MEGGWGLANFSDEGGYVEKYVHMSWPPRQLFYSKNTQFSLMLELIIYKSKGEIF